MTSHPFDAHERLFEAMRDCEAVCEHLHLPVQSGSNRILKAMRRGYTVESYLAQVERLRALVPEIALTTDIIVGFPGETDEDFAATRRLLEHVRYAGTYIFRYSPRPGTTAADLADDVPADVKERRQQILLDLQREMALHDRQRYVGRSVELLIEGPSRHGQLLGRTRDNTSVVLDGPAALIGQLVHAEITAAHLNALTGRLASPHACHA